MSDVIEMGSEGDGAVRARGRSRRLSRLGLSQGLFFAASGLWPIVHYASFEAVTGRKREPWLVKTVGGLLAVVGGVLTAAGARRRVTGELAALGAGAAGLLALVDVVYAGRRRISPVYLADAAVELGLVGLWGRALRPSPSEAAAV